MQIVENMAKYYVFVILNFKIIEVEIMDKRYEITALCGMGLGSSSIARMVIMEFIDKYKINASVNVADIGMIKGLRSDIVLTTKSMESHIPKEMYENMKVVFVTNLMKKDEINNSLYKIFKEWGAIK